MSGIHSLKNTIYGTLELNSTTFEYAIYPNPHKKIPINYNKITNKERQDFEELNLIISIFGNRIQKNTPCLNINETFVKDNIYTHSYAALIFVKNSKKDDSTTTSLQYSNWCEGEDPNKNKKLWINDLCRINHSNSSGPSPTAAIFKIIENFSKERKLNFNYLMVDKDKSSTDKLISIYNKYGFTIDETCLDSKTIIMKKTLKNSGGSRKTLRKSRFL